MNMFMRKVYILNSLISYSVKSYSEMQRSGRTDHT